MSASISTSHIQIHEFPAFVIRLPESGSFAELVIRDGILYDETVARQTKTVLETNKPGLRIYLLVSSDGFFRVTKGVRRLGASAEFSSHLAAVAFYTNNFSLSLLGELYNKINQPAVLTKVFWNRENALEWLRQQFQK